MFSSRRAEADGEGTGLILSALFGTEWKMFYLTGVALYTVDREGALKSKVKVDDGGMATEDLVVADLNGDKQPDIIASGRATRNVKIYWNETRR